MKQKYQRLFLVFAFVAITATVTAGLLVSEANALETGLGYGTYTGLGEQDIRVSIMQVVRVALGFLGVLAILIIIYGGFVWMTAGGRAERIELAKKILTSAVIGLVIIMLSFAIASFIITQLISATIGTTPFSCTPNDCLSCNTQCNATGDGIVYPAPSCNTPAYCSVPPTASCPKPLTTTPTICKMEARRGTGLGGVPQGAQGDYVLVEGWYFGTYAAGVSAVTFDAAAADVVSCNATPYWYQQGSGYSVAKVEIPSISLDTYDVTLTADLGGSAVVSAAYNYEVVASSTSLPNIACVVPPSGQNNQTLTRVEGTQFGSADGALTFFNGQAASFAAWSTDEITSPVVPAAAVSGNVFVTDATGGVSNNEYFTVTCADNTDCVSGCCLSNACVDAAQCAGQPGQTCDPNLSTPAVCEPGGTCVPGAICNQSTCICDPLPVIQYIDPDPALGAAGGSMVTIGGQNFGTSTGQVFFSRADGTWVLAQLASTVNSECTASWTDTEVVVVVPNAAALGPIRLVRRDASGANTGEDRTNDSWGPQLSDFNTNGPERPGVCSVLTQATPQVPEGAVGQRVVVRGINFDNTTPGNNKVFFAAVEAGGNITLPGPRVINGATVPSLATDVAYGVRVERSGVLSNAKTFTVIPGTPQTTFECSSTVGICTPDQQRCQIDQICNASCECVPDPGIVIGVGDPCDANTSIAGCQDNNLCDTANTGLSCNVSTCTCQPAQAQVSEATYAFSFLSGLQPGACTADPLGGICIPDDTFCADVNQFCDPLSCNCVNVPVAQCVEDDTALALDGTGAYAQAASDPSLNLSFFTIEAWVNSAANTTQPLDTVVQARDSSGHVSLLIKFDSNPNPDPIEQTWRYQVLKNTGSGAGNAGVIPVSVDQWYHLALTVSPSQATFYVNGEHVDQLSLPATSSSVGLSDLIIGAEEISDGTFDGFFNGRIDDVAVYDRVLTAKEVRYLAQNRRVADSALVHFWRFNEGSASTTADTVGSLDADFGGDADWGDGHFICTVDQPPIQPGSPCSTSQNSCVPSDALCDPTNTGLTCDPSSCTCQSATGVPNEATYAWTFTTSTFGPEVVASCTRTNSCDVGTWSSPTPFDRSGTDFAGFNVSTSRRDDGPVAIDAMISAVFTQLMHEPSLTLSAPNDDQTVTVRQCNSGANDDALDCSSSTIVAGTFHSVSGDSCLYAGDNVGCFTIQPDTVLNTDTWYMVELDASNILGANGVSLVGNSADGNYRWLFRTQVSSDLSTVGCLNITPANWLFTQYNQEKKYIATPSAEDNVCIDIRPEACTGGYTWSTGVASKGNVNAVAIIDTAFNTATTTARQQTIDLTPDWVSVDALCKTPVGNVPGYGEARIDFSSPYVINRFPDCGTACLNGKIGATFSKQMDTTTSYSVLENMELYVCYGDRTCDPANMEPASLYNSRLDPSEASNTYVGDGCLTVYSSNGAQYCLLPNTTYRVVVSGLVRSANEHQYLAGLNFNDPDVTPGWIAGANQNTLDSYSWVFTTQPNYGLCVPSTIDVVPAENRTSFNRAVPYAASGRTAPDACDPDYGQRISPYTLGWNWISNQQSGWSGNACTNGTDPVTGQAIGSTVVDFQGFIAPTTDGLVCRDSDSTLLRDSCGNGVLELGEDCDDGNILSGDGCTGVWRNATQNGDSAAHRCSTNNNQTACEGDNFCIWAGNIVCQIRACINEGTAAPTCGNGVIDVGEDCDDGNTVGGDDCSATCLAEGNADYADEICGNGIIESSEQCDPPGPGCSANCTLSGTVIGRSLCGDGQIGLGEQCDAGQLRSGTPVSPTTYTDNGVTISCSTSCLAQNLTTYPVSFCRNTATNLFDFAGGPCTGSSQCSSGWSCRLLSTASGNTVTTGAICGNGVREVGEECDDGKIFNGYCSNDPSIGCDTIGGSCSVAGSSCISDGCTNRCTNAGSAYEFIGTETGAYQIAQSRDLNGEAWLHTWVSQREPTAGPVGEGHVVVGALGNLGVLYITEVWPDCGSTCVNADIGADFSVVVNDATLLPDTSVLLYECGSDAACPIGSTSVTQLTDIGIQPQPGSGTWQGFRIDLPPGYNTINGRSSLLPSTWYRVVVREDIATPGTNPEYLTGLNFNLPNYGTDPSADDSFSWTFKTIDNPSLCTPHRVEIRPDDATVNEGGVKTLYFAQPRSTPDQCDLLGQRLDPYRYDWNWNDVELLPGLTDAAYLLSPDLNRANPANNPAGAVDSNDLFDGCGNGAVEAGEDCDWGLDAVPDWSVPGGAVGCTQECRWSGTAACVAAPAVPNNTFDINISNWQVDRAGIASTVPAYDNVIYYLAPGSARVDIPATANPWQPTGGFGQLVSRAIPTLSGGLYEYSAWVKTETGQRLELAISNRNPNPDWVDGNGQTWGDYQYYSPACYSDLTVTGWQQVRCIVSIPPAGTAGDAPVQLQVRAFTAGLFWVDDVDLRRVDQANCCGNNIIEYGEECDETSAYCSPSCLLNGNNNYSAAGFTPLPICGNGIVEAEEQCDTGTSGLVSDADGCTDRCVYAGAVPGVNATCGDGQIGIGEECDDGLLVGGTSAGSCTYPNDTYYDRPCQLITAADTCADARLCYWTGNECRVRPCLIGDFGSGIFACKLNPTTSPTFAFDFASDPTNCPLNSSSIILANQYEGNDYWQNPMCGNKRIEVGEKCDDGGWCVTGANSPALSNGSPIRCTTVTTPRLCPTNSYCQPFDGICSTDGSPCTGIGSTCDTTGSCLSDGCSDSCTFGVPADPTFSVAADGLIDPYQIVVSLDDVVVNLTEVKEEIRAWTGVAPNVVGIGELTVITGGGVPFTVIGHQPPIDSIDQCRNVAISATLSHQVDIATIAGTCSSAPTQQCLSSSDCVNAGYCQFDTVFVSQCSSGVCSPTNNIIRGLRYRAVQGACDSANRCLFPGADSANLPMQNSFCASDADCRGSVIEVSEIDQLFLAADTRYQVYLNDDIRSINDQALSAGQRWAFRTSNDFCQCDYLGVTIDYTSAGATTQSDFFTCADNKCGQTTTSQRDDDVADNYPVGSGEFNFDGNQHLYRAQCWDVTNPQNAAIQLSDATVRYTWQEIDPEGILFLGYENPAGTLDALPLFGQQNQKDIYVTPGYVTPSNNLTPAGKNGRATILTSAFEYRCVRSGQLCAPQPGNPNGTCTANTGPCQQEVADTHRIEVTNFICANPWPSLTSYPFEDSGTTCGGAASCIDTNFELFYCRDAGGPGKEDDLPPLLDAPLVVPQRGSSNVLKEFIFPVGTSSLTPAVLTVSMAPRLLNDGDSQQITVSAKIFVDPNLTSFGSAAFTIKDQNGIAATQSVTTPNSSHTYTVSPSVTCAIAGGCVYTVDITACNNEPTPACVTIEGI